MPTERTPIHSEGAPCATPTETLVAELREAEGQTDLEARAAEVLTTQSALIETLRGERDEARQQYVDANEARIDAEAALADARAKALSDTLTALQAVQDDSDPECNPAFETAKSRIRALKSA